MSLSIEPAGRDRIDALASTYARAFLDDPIVRWPLPDVHDVPDRIRQVFASIYLGIADDGVIWEAGDADGFAVWIPAGAADDMFESDAAVQRSLAPLTADDGELYRVLWDWIEARVPDDVWYLDAIGVEPSRQGRGVGGALIPTWPRRREGGRCRRLPGNGGRAERSVLRAPRLPGGRARPACARRAGHLVHAHRRLTRSIRAGTDAVRATAGRRRTARSPRRARDSDRTSRR